MMSSDVPDGGSIATMLEYLHQVVLDDVAQLTDRVVERATVCDVEILGHGDLHRETYAVPHRVQQGVGES